MQNRKLQTRIKKTYICFFFNQVSDKMFCSIWFLLLPVPTLPHIGPSLFYYLYYRFFPKKSILRRSSSRSRRFKKGASRSENATAQHLARRLGALESRDPHRVPHYQCFYSCGTKTTAPHSRHRLIVRHSYKS